MMDCGLWWRWTSGLVAENNGHQTGRSLVCGHGLTYLDMDQTSNCSTPRGLSLHHCRSAPEQGTLLPQHLLPGRRPWLSTALCVHCVLCPAVFTRMGLKQRTNFPPFACSVCVCMCVGLIKRYLWYLVSYLILSDCGGGGDDNTSSSVWLQQ